MRYVDDQEAAFFLMDAAFFIPTARWQWVMARQEHKMEKQKW
jgi:hypothetical protein